MGTAKARGLTFSRPRSSSSSPSPCSSLLGSSPSSLAAATTAFAPGSSCGKPGSGARGSSRRAGRGVLCSPPPGRTSQPGLPEHQAVRPPEGRGSRARGRGGPQAPPADGRAPAAGRAPGRSCSRWGADLRPGTGWGRRRPPGSYRGRGRGGQRCSGQPELEVLALKAQEDGPRAEAAGPTAQERGGGSAGTRARGAAAAGAPDSRPLRSPWGRRTPPPAPTSFSSFPCSFFPRSFSLCFFSFFLGFFIFFSAAGTASFSGDFAASAFLCFWTGSFSLSARGLGAGGCVTGSRQWGHGTQSGPALPGTYLSRSTSRAL